jgi:hypothetical protein
MTDVPAANRAAAAFLQRHPDGRHAVMDQNGNLVGLHNSLQSAQRQLADYYEAPHMGTPQALGQLANQAATSQPSAQPLGQLAHQGQVPQQPAPPAAGYGQAQQLASAQAAPAYGHAALQAAGGAMAHTPTPQDIAAGERFGAALIHAHPFANPQQLVDFAHQMGQQHAQSGLGMYAHPMAGAMDQARTQDQLQLRAQNQAGARAQGAGAPQPGQVQALGLGPHTQRLI